MGRLNQVPVPRNDAEGQDSEDRKHAANVLLPEIDWYRAQWAAQLEGEARSASDIIRKALAKYLDEHEQAQDLAILAEESQRRDIALDAKKKQLLKNRVSN